MELAGLQLFLIFQGGRPLMFVKIVCSHLVHCLTKCAFCVSCSLQGVRLCLDMHVLALLLLPSSLSSLCSHVHMHDCLINTHSCLCPSLRGYDRLNITATQTDRKYVHLHTFGKCHGKTILFVALQITGATIIAALARWTSQRGNAVQDTT